MKLYDNSPVAKHSEQVKTLELVFRNYLWPYMANQMNDYIDIYNRYKATKKIHKKPVGSLQPNTI